jgi:NAD(P)-dependent dehydrogenase (short-subunit alcohol dehydrogenase family)
LVSKSLAGRHVVVTGGTGALGQVVVAQLLEAGAVCHVPSHRGNGEVQLERDGRLHIVTGVELTDEASADAFYNALPELWASVHLAGSFAMSPLTDTTREDFRQMFEINALTVFLCCRAAVHVMRGAGSGGRLVNVAARPALDPRKGAYMAAYATSKAAVAALTQALAEELKGDRILVNAIAPSTIDASANCTAMPEADPAKWLTPQAAAEAILHLASPSNMEISGAILPLYARA